MNNINSWNQFSQFYLKEAKISNSTVHYGLCIAGEDQLKILPNLKYVRLLDVGCGGGENCIALEKKGALVTGIEPCYEFYTKAYNNNIKNPNIRIFNKSWNDNLLKLNELFQCVLFIGSSEYIELNFEFFNILNAITTPDCFLLISRMHPMWTSLFDHETGPIKFKNYFSSREDNVTYGDAKINFSRNHYSLEELVKRFSQNNWRLITIKEPKFEKKEDAPYYFEGCYEDTIFKKRLSLFPMTLIITFKRHGEI